MPGCGATTGYQSTRHTRVSSHSQLVTSEHITSHHVVIFCLHAGQVAPRNSAQHGRRNYGERAYNKTCSSVWLFGFNVHYIEVTDDGEALECDEC